MNTIRKIQKIIVFALILLGNQVFGQTNIGVDERFELVNIAFRLTGKNVFVYTDPANYMANIDNYFSKYKNHELIKFLRQRYEPMSMIEIGTATNLAADIEITSKGIVVTNQWIPFVKYEEYGVDKHDWDWSEAEFKECVKLLNKFYKDTKFHQFFLSNRSFYASIEKEFQKLVDQIDTAWFQDVFSKPYEMDNIWLVPSNGVHNFATLRKDAAGNSYNNCEIACPLTNAAGEFIFSEGTFQTLIHEICHNYTSPICQQNEAFFKEICDTLYNTKVGKVLRANAYGDPGAFTYEGINRLCEFYYYQTHNTFDSVELDRRIHNDETKGFIWLEEMLRLMDVFASNRDIYPDFQSFVPQLHGFLSEVANNMDKYYWPKYQLLFPRVVATYPANGAVVDTNVTAIYVFFSQPMFTPMRFSEGVNDRSDVTFLPVDFDNISWVDGYTYKVPLSEPLKPKTKYGFRINRPVSDKYHYGIPPYDLIFETK